MANQFNIEIAATDRASATLKKINDAVAKFTKPVTIA